MIKPNKLASKTKNKIIFTIIIIFFITTSISGIILHNQAKLNIDTEIIEYNDPNDIHRVSELKIEVTNNGDKIYNLKFNIVHSQLQTRFYWDIISGPKKLKPQQTAIYTINAPVPQAAIPYNSTAIISVNPSGKEKQKKLAPKSFNPISPPEILNPNFIGWHTDPNKDYFEPYRWVVSSNRGVPNVSYKNNTAFLYIGGFKGEEHKYIVSQTIGFPEKLTIKATPYTVINNISDQFNVISGISISDNRRNIYILFSDILNRQIRYKNNSQKDVYLFIPAQEGEKLKTTINISRIYDRYDWEKPNNSTRTIDGVDYKTKLVEVSAFIEAKQTGNNTVYNLAIHNISS